jgi:hypothetical protein
VCPWVPSFVHDEMLPAGRLEVTASHDNFLDLPDGERFEIEIKYRRKTEGSYNSLSLSLP